MADNMALIKGALDLDPFLEPYSNALISRQLLLHKWMEQILASEASLYDFATSYTKYGVHANKDTKEINAFFYIPNVNSVSLVGEFNNWEPRTEHWALKNE